MRKTAVERIANRISKKYGMVDGSGKALVVVTRRRESKNSFAGLEIRTELPSYEGGSEMQEAITRYYREKLDIEIIVESCGGCVYFAYIS